MLLLNNVLLLVTIETNLVHIREHFDAFHNPPCILIYV
ncbi:hypothetical protein BCE_3320 [Bacillus cereus ATCC 10987]|uniref:Uncharacterized protein n=1 Tax=Bacillus cereus (strain ATCC 10987 / NRS 248) TaxID=222523 RepID=Q734T4_BACC1|nr:hypothetical protein BCE_3320 [Bacillus cereus ATCC 10987]